MRVTATSTWPWLDHRASDLILHTIALFRLGFPTPTPNGLSSHARLTRGPIIQKVRSHGTSPLLLFVCTRFQVLFHSPPGVLFAFPSRYWFTIGRYRVFSLGGWSPHVQTGFHVSRPTCRILSSTPMISYKGLSPSMARVSNLFYYQRC